MSLSQLEQESKFKKHLGQYWNSKGITQIKIPQIGGQQLNLFKLYKAVCKKGGGQAVSHNKLWKQIVDQFGLPSTCTSASFTLKNHYQKYLLGYEQRFFFGKDDSADLPELVAGRQRKPMKDGQNIIISSRFGGYHNEGQIMQSTLAAQLKKYYERSDHSQYINYIKRTKMYPVMSEVKHMILAFQSVQKQDIIFGINMLLLFSNNTQAPFLFSQYPDILESISQFVEKNYPPKNNIFQLECLRTVILAVRNLLINHKNLQPFLESSLIEILSKIFQDRFDPEITRNVSDIFSSLTRIGWDCSKQLLEMVQFYLEKDSTEDMQTGIDLLRSLVEQKQEMCEAIIGQKMDFFARLLIHSSIQIRQSILQIFVYLTQKSQKTKWICLKHFKFMQRLLALMSNSLGIYQKQAQLSCLIVNNISQMHSHPEQEKKQQLVKHLKRFEKNLMLISFNDQFLSPITSSILFNLSGRVSGSTTLKEGENQRQKVLVEKIRKNMIDRDRLSEQDEQDESDDDLQQQESEQQERTYRQPQKITEQSN